MCGGSKLFFNEDFKMSLMKMAKTNNGLFWKGLRGSYKTTRRYVRSGARTVEFTLMTVVLATAGLVGYGQVTGEGPKISFDRGEMVFVDYDQETRITTILNNGAMERYKLDYKTWSNVDEFEGPVVSEKFLNRCEAFADFHRFNSEKWLGQDDVPRARITSWIPTLVFPDTLDEYMPNSMPVDTEVPNETL